MRNSNILIIPFCLIIVLSVKLLRIVASFRAGRLQSTFLFIVLLYTLTQIKLTFYNYNEDLEYNCIVVCSFGIVTIQ